MVKMVDVAKHAGTSVKTVSRVVNHEPHVQDALRQKVWDSIKFLGYVPSPSARTLRSNRSYTIHMIAHKARSNFINALQAGALTATEALGYRLVTTMLDQQTIANPKAFTAWCQALQNNGKPDGIILVPPYSNNPHVNETISSYAIPIIRIGPNDITDNNTTIMIDDRSAARDAVQYLIQLGHKRIAFIRGIEEQNTTHERFKGYMDALSLADLKLDKSLVMPGAFSFESGLKAGHKLLALANPPSAIFAANDDMAAGVLVAAHSLGIKVPEQLSVFGFDDSELAEKMWPALTTIRQPLIEFGESAIKRLVSIVGMKADERISHVDTLDYEMVVRQSTGPFT